MGCVYLAGVEDCDDVRMVQSRSRTGLLPETPNSLDVLSNFGEKQFDGDITAQAGVARSIDFAHAAFAYFLEEFVMQ